MSFLTCCSEDGADLKGDFDKELAEVANEADYNCYWLFYRLVFCCSTLKDGFFCKTP